MRKGIFAVAMIAALIVLGLFMFNTDDNQVPVSFDRAEMKEYYIDFAMANRIDFIPDFEEGTYATDKPVSSTDFLMLTYYLNKDNLPEDNSMRAALVEQVMKEHFGIEKVEHKSQFKGWTYLAEEDKYIPYPEGTAEDSLFDVVSFNSYSENDREIYEVVLREYRFPFIYQKEDPASIYRYDDCLAYANDTKNVYHENVSFLLAEKGDALKNGECNIYEAFYDLIVTDNTDGFTMGNTIKIKYYLDDTTGKACFLAKQEELSDFVFPEKYDEVIYEKCPDDSYRTRFVLVRKGEYWGIVNGLNGKEILNPDKYGLDKIYINTYEEVWPLIEVVKDEKHGMLNYRGEMLIEPQYEYVWMDVYNIPNVVFVYDGEKWGGIKLTFEGYQNQFEYTAVKAGEVDYDMELSKELPIMK